MSDNPISKKRAMFRRGGVATLCVGVAMFVVALIVTRDLPMPSCYEVRYEMYVVGTDRPDTMFKDLSLYSPYILSRYLKSAISVQDYDDMDVSAWCDKAGKLTVRLRGADANELLDQGNQLFSYIKDCANGESYLWTKWSVRDSSKTEIGVVLLNEDAAYQVHRTPNRWLVVLVSVLAAMLLCGMFVVLRSLGSSSNAESDDVAR